MNGALPVTAGTVRQVMVGQVRTDIGAESYGGRARTDSDGRGGVDANVTQRLADAGSNADSPGRTGRSAGDGRAALAEGVGRGGSLVERGYVHARFGGVPVLVGPELAAQLRSRRQEQP